MRSFLLIPFGPLVLSAGLSLASVEAAAQAVAPQQATATVTARMLMRGDTLTPDDLTQAMLPISMARGAVPASSAIGMAVRRTVPEGSVLRPIDLEAPALVKRGDTVTIEMIKGPMRISTAGRALDNGAAGRSVRVVSTTTNRTVDAVVYGPGTVRMLLP